MNSTVQRTLQKLMKHVKNILNETCRNPNIEEFVLLTYNNCETITPKDGELFLFLTLFINTSVVRDDVEEKLILFTETNAIWRLSTDGMLFTVNMSRSETALLIPMLMWQLDQNTHCFVRINLRTVGPSEYRNVIISPLLKCQSLQFEGSEFGMNWDGLQIEHSYTGLTFTSFHYETYYDGKLQLCGKDIPVQIENLKAMGFDLKNSSISIFTTICITGSMLCLMLIIVTYCYFPQLRSLTGINGMILAIFVSTTQVSLLIKQLQLPVNDFAWSIFQHFSWLSICFWQQVCSFYLHQIACSRSAMEITNRYVRKVVFNSIFFSICLSALFLAPNIVQSCTLSGDMYISYDKTPSSAYKPLFLATLMGPLCFVLLSNSVVFLVTATHIDINQNINDQNTANILKQLSDFQKLLFLSLGFWLMQIIGTMVNVSSFSYIADVFIGLHGLFLFASYMCNDRVFNAYKTFCGSCIPMQMKTT